MTNGVQTLAEPLWRGKEKNENTIFARMTGVRGV